MKRPRTDATPLGDEIRSLAVTYKSDGQDERAEGLVQAADLVDMRAAQLTGKAMIELLRVMLRGELEEFVADVAAAVRSDSVPPPAPAAPPRARKEAPRPPPVLVKPARLPAPPPAPRHTNGASSPAAADGLKLGPGPHKVLVAIAQHHPATVTPDQIAAIVGFKKSYRDLNLQLLARLGFIVRTRAGSTATEAGLRELGPTFKKLPTGAALLAHWLEELPEGEARALRYITGAYPHSVDGDLVGEACSFKRSYRNLVLQTLRRRRLVEKDDDGRYRASSSLFGGRKRTASEARA